jgi:hypothetical protein
VEAVEFQAVGMQLRECMISLVAVARRRVEISGEATYPQDANVIEWSRRLIDELCPGSSNKELRQYLRATTEHAWQLVNWITHHRNANKTATLIAHEAVGTIVSHMVNLLSRERQDFAIQCPRCASRRLRTFFDVAIEPDGAYFENCGECGWSGHPGYDGATDPDLVKVCESQLDRAREDYDLWLRAGNESMIALSASLIENLEMQLEVLREGSNG